MNDFSFGRKIKFDTSGNPIINANILPSTTLSYDLGSSDKRWRDIYLSGNTIDLDGTKIQKEVGGGIKIADASGNTLDGKFNNIDISGNAIINGIINQAVQLDVSGSILPTRNLVYDLGSPDKRWNDLYLSGNTIDLSGTLLSRHTDGSLMVHDSNSNMVNLRANNIIADGNLTVSGTTTTINSTTVTVQDPIITLGSDTTNTKDKGIEFKYGTGKIGFFGYDDSTGNLTFLKDASNNSEVFSGTQGTIEGSTFKSTVVNGIAPLAVTSSTLVTNLNADLLDGLNNDKFMRTDIDTSTTGTITSSSTITGTRLVSTVPFGTAPLSVTSSTLVTNLNSMLFYGLGSTQFMRSDINTSTTGNVGIGTNNTATKLQVQSSSITTGISIQNADVHTILGNTGGVTNCGSIQVKAAGSSSTIGTTNYNLCLNPDGGNVIIGGSSPLSRLTVKNSYGDGQDGGICIDATDGSVYNMRIYSYVQGGSQVGYAFKVNNISSSTNAICLGYNGNLGIGVLAPVRNLHGIGEFSWTPGSNNNNVAFFNVHDSAGSNGTNYSVVWRGLSNSGSAQVKLSNFTIESSTLTVNGSVAISSSMSVNGGWIAASFGSGSGNRVVIGEYQGSAWVGAHNNPLNAWATLVVHNASLQTTSDRTVKENIITADTSICYQNIRKLRIVRFNYINDLVPNLVGADKNVLGIIAQELELVFPKSVSITKGVNNSPDLKAINLDQITYSLIGALQHCQNKIEQQDAEIQDLKTLQLSHNNLLLRFNELEAKVKILSDLILK